MLKLSIFGMKKGNSINFFRSEYGQIAIRPSEDYHLFPKANFMYRLAKNKLFSSVTKMGIRCR